MHKNTIVKDYTILWNEEIGTGNFASVFKCIHNPTKKVYAAKVLEKVKIDMDETLKQSFEDEVIAIQVKSENIVGFIQLLQCKNYYYIVQELCDCNLRDYMKKNKFMPEKEAIRIIRQIASGVYDLYLAHITHRDLKPENIFLKDLKVQIGDFGVSKRNSHNKCIFEVPAGSITYMSLEALKGHKYTSKCDIWSIGLIFYELLHGKYPWYRQGDNKNALIHKISHESLKINNTLQEITRNFIKKCLVIDQESRFEWVNFFAHPIFEKKYKQLVTTNQKYKRSISKTYQNLAVTLINKKTTLLKIFSQIFPNKNLLDFTDFYRLLLWGDKTTQQQEAMFIFEETDLDKDGLVSSQQIENQMRIQCRSYVEGSELRISNTDHQKKKAFEVFVERQTIKWCFEKANAILKIKNIPLRKIYQEFSFKSDQMSQDQFINFMKKYWVQLDNSDVRELFHLLTNSGYINFYDFNLFNEKVIEKGEQDYHHLKLRHKQSCPVQYQTQDFDVPSEEFTKGSIHTMNQISQFQNIRQSEDGGKSTFIKRKYSNHLKKTINKGNGGNDWEV